MHRIYLEVFNSKASCVTKISCTRLAQTNVHVTH